MNNIGDSFGSGVGPAQLPVLHCYSNSHQVAPASIETQTGNNGSCSNLAVLLVYWIVLHFSDTFVFTMTANKLEQLHFVSDSTDRM